MSHSRPKAVMGLNPGWIVLKHSERDELVRLLGLLQIHLKSAIESAIVPGTGQPMPEDWQNVASDIEDHNRAGSVMEMLLDELEANRRRQLVRSPRTRER